MIHVRLFITRIAFVLLLFVSQACDRQPASVSAPGWPEVARQTKPWTRWWWHGSQVTKEGISAEMEAYQKAGIGGLEITPIYGVYGEEDQFIDFLSPQWMDMLAHVLSEAQRLDMGIDMATGTGWPFGGPWVTSADACKNIRHKIYEVNGGEQLKEKIEFIQEPYLRLVGNQIYEVNENASAEGRALLGTRKEPALISKNQVVITDIIDPVEKNSSLQALAIDQVQFEKALGLVVLMAFNEHGESVDLTNQVDGSGSLSWTAPAGNWKLYAIFEGFHGKMVERAGPGGEGNVIDHFSDRALKNYLQRFDQAFDGRDITSLRAFFNDSYEVDDARGSADFTPALFEEFMKRRGYDLRSELPALLGHDNTEKNRRVLCDYRETISELLLDNFTVRWKEWAHQQNKLVRNQAHGSPSNILDLYATVDIPEIEGTEPLRFKMAASSGNVTGKKLISAEAATWLDEHFTSGLSDVKSSLDKFMLHGVNHLVYHGTCYSPSEEPWPGRLFYAAIHMNPRNPMWKDADALNDYITRCQSFLQRSSPDNDVLLYYPIYDPFSTPGPEMIEHFDGIGRAFEGSGFAQCAEVMLERGFAFDYISDKQLRKVAFEKGVLTTEGKSSYRAIVVPPCEFMPLATIEQLVALARKGAPVIFIDTPGDVSGYADLENKRNQFTQLISEIESLSDTADHNIQIGENLEAQLIKSGVQPERMFGLGVHGIRKKDADGNALYFIVKQDTTRYEGWLPLRDASENIVLYDPMNGEFGMARKRASSSGMEVFVQLEPAQSLILQGYDEISLAEFPYREISSGPIALEGQWSLRFESGGPELPPALALDSLHYWTDLKPGVYQNFSGTAVYELTFDRPEQVADRYLLTFPSIKETAEIILNGKVMGTLIGPVYQMVIDNSLLQSQNVLQVQVSNLMANRIAHMDRTNVFWKKFYNVNFPARLRENSRNNIFDASDWEPRDSGISGPAVLYPLR